MNQLSEDFKLYYNRAWLWDLEPRGRSVLFSEQEPGVIDFVVSFSLCLIYLDLRKGTVDRYLSMGLRFQPPLVCWWELMCGLRRGYIKAWRRHLDIRGTCGKYT
jgi:hypothetical protein